MMSWRRIRAVLSQEYHITRRSLEVLLDLYFFTAISTMMFGLISRFLSGSFTGPRAYYLLLGLVLWEVVRMTQYSMSVSSLWNVWSHNFGNMFVTPLSMPEYLVAQVISATLKVLPAIVVIGAVAVAVFGLDLPGLGPANLALFFVNLSVFSWSVGLVLLGLIFCYGTRIQALAWGVVFLFQPLCAAFFPLSILPRPVRAIALALPPTHVFEAARAALTTHRVDVGEAAWMTGLNVISFAVAAYAFMWMVRRSQTTGQFAKNDQ